MHGSESNDLTKVLADSRRNVRGLARSALQSEIDELMAIASAPPPPPIEPLSLDALGPIAEIHRGPRLPAASPPTALREEGDSGCGDGLRADERLMNTHEVAKELRRCGLSPNERLLSARDVSDELRRRSTR
jgi:hypothetical protein